MRYRVEAAVHNGVDVVVTVTRLTLRTIPKNSITEHQPVILEISVRSVNITKGS